MRKRGKGGKRPLEGEMEGGGGAHMKCRVWKGEREGEGGRGRQSHEEER